MTDTAFIGAIDLGGTKILSIVVDPDMRVMSSDQRPTEAGLGPDGVVARMVASVRAAAGDRPLRAIGISSPGPLNPFTGTVTSAANLPGWRNVPLARLVSEGAGVPAWLEHDAKAAAIAEHRLGAGRGSAHMVLLALGTGIGGGLVLNGQVYRGASGAAGEVGHTVLLAGGRLCTCGRRGCFEALSSGWALAARAAEIVAEEPDGVLARTSKDEGGKPSARTLEKAAKAGDESAAAAIREAGYYLGLGLANMVQVFNPEVLAITGNLRKLDGYLDRAKEVVREQSFRQSFQDVRLLETELGDDAAALGAALVALDHIEGSLA